MFVQAISKLLDFVIALILVSMEVSSAIAMAMLAYITVYDFATMGEITASQVMMFALSEVLLGLLMYLIIYLIRRL